MGNFVGKRRYSVGFDRGGLFGAGLELSFEKKADIFLKFLISIANLIKL